jgi:hypothetical protein
MAVAVPVAIVVTVAAVAAMAVTVVVPVMAAMAVAVTPVVTAAMAVTVPHRRHLVVLGGISGVPGIGRGSQRHDQSRCRQEAQRSAHLLPPSPSPELGP